MFGVVFQLTGSYRPAIFALIVFFVVGGASSCSGWTGQGIREAGNQAPAVL